MQQRIYYEHTITNSLAMTMENDDRPIAISPSADQPAATVPDGSAPVYVTTLRPSDVLLGRGAPIISYEGNVKFRDLVRSKKPLYVSTGRHQAKEDIAREIVKEISRTKGRFLKKVSSPEERQAQQKTREDPLWRVAEDSVAMEKVKQALRDKERAKSERLLEDEETAAFGGEPSSHPLSTTPLGFGGSSMPNHMNPLASLPFLQAGQPFGLSDRTLLGGHSANSLESYPPVLRMHQQSDMETLPMLLLRQQELHVQQLQSLRLQMLQNEHVGSMRGQDLLRSLHQLQSASTSNSIDPTMSLGSATMAAVQLGAGNHASMGGFLPHLSNADMGLLLQQQRRFDQMRTSSQNTSRDVMSSSVLGSGATRPPPALLPGSHTIAECEDNESSEDGDASDTSDHRSSLKGDDTSETSKATGSARPQTDRKDDEDKPAAKRLKR